MDIGQKIKRLRIKNGLTLEELASRSELTKGFLSQVERNLTSPSITTLNDILEALGTSLASFFKEDIQNYIRLHFAKSDDTLYAALERLEKLCLIFQVTMC